MFRKLFARTRPTRPTSTEDVHLLSGDRTVQVVGESFYQNELNRICGGKTRDGHQLPVIATLVPEPANEHDPNAVGVIVNGRKVGHLDSKKAAMLQRPIIEAAASAGKPLGCRAVIVGGWDRGRNDQGHFGINLFFNEKALLPQPARSRKAAPKKPAAQKAANRNKQVAAHPQGDASRTGRLWALGAMPDGIVHDRHFTEWVETVKQLKREDRLDEAIQLLRQCADATEDEAAATGLAPGSWYFEQLAICFRKQRDYDAEVAILERFVTAPLAQRNIPDKLFDRLAKARQLQRG